MIQNRVPNPYSAPAATGRPGPQPHGSFPDRRTALTVFGALQILLGLLFVGMTFLIPVAVVVTARSLQQEPSYVQAIPSMLVYLLVGATLITLGVGSMQARRWARNLILVVGWAWLFSGIISLLGFAWILPRVFAQVGETEGMPAGAQNIVVVFTIVFGAVFLVVIPGILVLFYRAPSVKATFEANQPEPDWTEACPLPVLTASVWIFVSALFLLVAPLSVHGTIPFFGALLTGLGGSMLYWVLAGLWGYSAWGLYKLRASSLWLIFGSTLVFGASSIVTFLRVDPMSMYEKMGYSEAQLAAMRQVGMFSGPEFALWIGLFLVPFLGYLLYLRKYLNS